MVQDENTGNDAGGHREGGTWVALKDAAALLDVSIDTVKRRMQRGELESRRETIPQGFRWLVRIDPGKTEATESPVMSENENRGLAVPSANAETITFLRHELEVRNREIAELHATMADLARALAQQSTTQNAVTDTTQDAAESPQSDKTGSLSILAWIRRLLSS